jgi:hypothetical protein
MALRARHTQEQPARANSLMPQIKAGLHATAIDASTMSGNEMMLAWTNTITCT